VCALLVFALGASVVWAVGTLVEMELDLPSPDDECSVVVMLISRFKTAHASALQNMSYCVGWGHGTSCPELAALLAFILHSSIVAFE
tara:strand:+ start:296 stop:556 length:261 start_codon:yes stop_codon:yes gene_type:complete